MTLLHLKKHFGLYPKSNGFKNKNKNSVVMLLL